MVNPDEDILQQFVQEEPSESPLTLLAGNTTTTNDAQPRGLNAYRASGASVQPAKSPQEIYNQLHPEAATRIQRFFELADERGLGLKPGSMNRDYGTQAKMYADKQAGLRGAYQNLPVSPPGSSTHMGFATDFSGYKPEKLQAIRELAKEVGLVYGGNWNGKTFDPVHIQLGPGSDVTRYIQQHINPQAGSVNWEGVRTTALPEDFLKRAIAAAQGQNVDAIYVPTKEVKVEGAPNATGSATVEPDAVKEADAKVEVTKKRKDIDFAKLIKMLDDSSHGGADYLSRSMQANAQQAQANRSRSLAQIAQFDQEQVNKMAEALKGGRTQSFKEGGEFEEDDNPYKDQVVKEYKPTLRDRIANLLAGDEPSFDKQRIVENIAGSRGIGATGIGALDFVPIVGNALGADESLREGDYKGAALAVMPVPPAARMVAPVAKAETKNILNIAEKYGVEPKEETWKHGISKNKLSRPIEEMSATTTDKNNVIPRKFITPADLKGGVIVPALGDRTAANQWLTHINEKELAYPVDLEGGANFMRSAAASGQDQAAWASQQGIISRLAKAAEAASKTGEPHLAFTAMSNRSGDYSGIMTDAILSQLPESKIAKKDIKAFDNAMEKFDPEWPGVKDKNIKKYLLDNGSLKTRFAETIAAKPFQDAGFPDIGSTRFAITDPELLHVPTGSSGYAISKLSPSGRIIVDPAVPHSTYKAQLPSEGYVGGLEHQLPLDVMYSDWIKKQNPDLLANAAKRDYKFKLDLPTQHANPEWVDQAMAWLRKNYPDIGYAKGGEVHGYNDGGPKLPDRPEYEMTDSSNAVDATPNTSLEQLFQAMTGGRNLQNDLSNIKSRLPTGQDYGHALLEQRDSTQAMNEQSRQNLREGYANRDIPQMLLGTGQGALGLINPAMAPINAGFEVLVNTAGKFDPRAKAEAELLGLVGTEGAGVTQKLHNLELPKSSWDALLKKYQDSGATQAMTIGLPAAVAAAERPVEAATRSLSPVGLYSHAAEMAEALPQAKGTPEQMRAMLFDKYGVKPAELEGFEEKFFGRPSVTKEELATHFRERMPQVEETILGGKQPFDVNRLKELEKEYAGLKEHPIDSPSFGEDKYNEMIRLMNIRDQSSTQSLYDAADQAMRSGQRAQSQGHKITAEKYFRESEFLNTRAEKLDLEDMGLASPTKYSDRTLPGGENYREVLLKHVESPEAKLERVKSYVRPDIWEAMTEDQRQYYLSAPDRGVFQSSHWKDDPNVLAHLRMSDRTGPKGEKLLHVEEMQSDWGQQGRQEGFWTPEKEKQLKEAQQKFKSFKSGLYDQYEQLLINDYNQTPIIARARTVQQSPKAIAEMFGKSDIYDELNKASNVGSNEKIPFGPYVTSTQGWTDLALKRVMKEAAEGGYEGVVFTPGAEQAKRYNLSNTVDRIGYNPDTKELNYVKKNSQSGPESHPQNVDPKDLPSLVGKEVADKLLNSKPNNLGFHVLAGDEMTVGGEGMKGYYDKIAPTQLQKMVKGYDKDVKLGQMAVPIEGKNKMPMLHMPVTDKMREHILKGQKAYMRGGRVGYADGGLVADNADGTGRQQYDAYGNVSDSQGGSVRAVAYDQNLVNTLAQQLNEGTYG